MDDNFWDTLSRGHTATTYLSSIDAHLSGKAFERDFTQVRELTDAGRRMGALKLPVPAGTMVVFAGDLGSMLSLVDPPAKGMPGEVVTVKAAGGDVTSHEGSVFVKWADGKLRSVHAEYLRLAKFPAGKKMTVEEVAEVTGPEFKETNENPPPEVVDLKDEMQKKKASANLSSLELRNSLKKFLLHEKTWFELDESQVEPNQALLTTRENGDVAEGTPGKRDVLEARRLKPLLMTSFPDAQVHLNATDEWMEVVLYIPANYGKKAVTSGHRKTSPPEATSVTKPKFAGKIIKADELNPYSKRWSLETFKQAYFKGEENVSPRIVREFWDDFRFAFTGSLASYIAGTVTRTLMASGLEDACWKDYEAIGMKEKDGKKVPNCVPMKSANRIRVSSLGDLTQFLKTAEGKLVHKSTKDLWSFKKDADGELVVERMFDDKGKPLKF